jgi:hypothetical protein
MLVSQIYDTFEDVKIYFFGGQNNSEPLLLFRLNSHFTFQIFDPEPFAGVKSILLSNWLNSFLLDGF